MPAIKCPSCGHVADYNETSNCVQCSGFIIVPEKGKFFVTRKTLGLAFFTLLLLAGAVYGINRYISMQKESERVEVEKKQLESFDYVTFNADAESVSSALGQLPQKYKSPPPSIETIKQSIGEFVSKKTEAKKFSQPALVNNDSPAPAAASTEQVKVYSLKDIEPLQYDYVKGRDGKLICFVNYRAVIQITDWQQEAVAQPTVKPLPESIVKETARYDLENGIWTIKQAGLTEQDRKAEIDKVRLEAKDMQPR